MNIQLFSSLSRLVDSQEKPPNNLIVDCCFHEQSSNFEGYWNIIEGYWDGLQWVYLPGHYMLTKQPVYWQFKSN